MNDYNDRIDPLDSFTINCDTDALDYQPVDSWLARVGGIPSKETSSPKASAVRVPLSLLPSPSNPLRHNSSPPPFLVQLPPPQLPILS